MCSLCLSCFHFLVPAGAKLNRRQTNRIECTSSKSQCQFYSHCIDSQFPCGRDGFILSYAEKRCELIDGLEPRIPGRTCSSPDSCVGYNGYYWAHETERCLKSALEEQFRRFDEEGLRNDPSVCLRWEQEAIDKMNACYSDAWMRYPLPETDAAILTRLFRIGEYFDTVVDKGIPSLLRHHNSTLATQLSTNQTYDRRLYCVKGSAGSTSRDLTREESIFVVQHALNEQDLPVANYHYGGKDSLYDGEPCERNQPKSINTNAYGFHLVSLFVPHSTNVNVKNLISHLIPQGFIAASMYELSARSDDATLSLVNYTRCGDGIRHASEECDYGNGAEGCSLNCKIQNGYDCTVDRLRPSMCSLEVCGDGLRTRGEECDDGNTADGDGCDGSCRLEQGTHSCVTAYNSTSVCQACPCTEQPKHVQFAPKQSPSYITARRISPPHMASKALAASREAIKRTVQLPAESSSSTSTLSSSLIACFALIASAATTNLLWR